MFSEKEEGKGNDEENTETPEEDEGNKKVNTEEDEDTDIDKLNAEVEKAD